jgi:hypothetical protein
MDLQKMLSKVKAFADHVVSKALPGWKRQAEVV